MTQYLGYCAFIAGLEGMLIGAKAGIDLEILAKIVPVSAGSSSVLNRATEAILNRSFASNGTLDIVAKDIHLACELARESQAPAAIGAIADDMFQRAQVQGMGPDGIPFRGPHPGTVGGGRAEGHGLIAGDIGRDTRELSKFRVPRISPHPSPPPGLAFSRR